MKTKAKKRISRKFSEASAKLQIDRFFEVMRKRYSLYAFQNESITKYQFLKDNNYTYLITKNPKRDFFVDENTLVEEGFEIEFNNLTKEQFEDVVFEVKKHFGNIFFYKFPKNDNRGKDETTLSGKILFKNLRKNNN